MARFSGVIGFGKSVKKSPGTWDDEITEKKYSGEIIRNVQAFQEGEGVNDDISLGNSISILADDYAIKNLQFIKYAGWDGALWKVTNVEIRRPRLILSLGGVYNGPTQ